MNQADSVVATDDTQKPFVHHETGTAPVSRSLQSEGMDRISKSETALNQLTDDHAAEEEMTDELLEADEVCRQAALNLKAPL